MLAGLFFCLLCLLLSFQEAICFSSVFSSFSIGQAIQETNTYRSLLSIAEQMWLPTDPNLPSHLMTQLVHHEKRQRWASQLLTKLAVASLSYNPSQTSTSDDDAVKLERAILAASLPFSSSSRTDRPSKEGRYMSDSLKALHALIGRRRKSNLLTTNARKGVVTLLERIFALSDEYSLREICEIRWAARGLQTRLFSDKEKKEITRSLQALDERVRELPFDIIPQSMDWNTVLQQEVSDTTTIVSRLAESIPFQTDTIVTRSGSSVIERRSTAWIAEEGIGALAYSGKLMPPTKIPSTVTAVMRAAEKVLNMPQQQQQPFFDCALCNLYPDGDSACKFHTDPEHGSHWDRLTVVVAAGVDRKFAFRPIARLTKWKEWDNHHDAAVTSSDSVAAVIHMFTGDMVVMKDTCNDFFEHAVHAAEDEKNHHGENYHGNGSRERISLVLKRALYRGGKRGHGLHGQGRRSRRSAVRNNNAINNHHPTASSGQNKPAKKKTRRGSSRKKIGKLVR